MIDVEVSQMSVGNPCDHATLALELSSLKELPRIPLSNCRVSERPFPLFFVPSPDLCFA